MSIGCGNCKGQHDTAALVRQCFLGGNDEAIMNKMVADADKAEAKAVADFKAKRDAVHAKADAATEKQVAFIKSLAAERNVDDTVQTDGITRKQASSIIETLLAMPKVKGAAKKTGGVQVHEDLAEGMHAIDGKFVKVYRTKHGSNQLVGKVLVIDGQDSDGKYRCHFEYGGKAALKGLTPEHKLSAEEAKQFGLLYGICVRCGLDLTKEESIHVGYGRTCAGHEGWWYPTKTELKAALQSA